MDEGQNLRGVKVTILALIFLHKYKCLHDISTTFAREICHKNYCLEMLEGKIFPVASLSFISLINDFSNLNE